MRLMDDPQRTGGFEARPRRSDGDPGRTATVIFGLLIIAVGLWFFADRTLGLDLPDIDWGSLWPLLLIAIGAWMVVGTADRRR